jgi:hypothetical protein
MAAVRRTVKARSPRVVDPRIEVDGLSVFVDLEFVVLVVDLEHVVFALGVEH